MKGLCLLFLVMVMLAACESVRADCRKLAPGGDAAWSGKAQVLSWGYPSIEGKKYLALFFLNLDLCDPQTGINYITIWLCEDYGNKRNKCPRVAPGETYRVAGRGIGVGEVLVDGQWFRPPGEMVWQTWACDVPKPAHWEGHADGARCVGGKGKHTWYSYDPYASVRALEKSGAKVPVCDDIAGFSNKRTSVVITMKPDVNLKWKFDEAPAVVAERLLGQLNREPALIAFSEASGTAPNFYIDVVYTSAGAVGTHQESFRASVRGLGRPGNLFNETSGDYPHTTWREAIDSLATRMLVWFKRGWRTKPPCLEPDGTIRRN